MVDEFKKTETDREISERLLRRSTLMSFERMDSKPLDNIFVR